MVTRYQYHVNQIVDINVNGPEYKQQVINSIHDSYKVYSAITKAQYKYLLRDARSIEPGESMEKILAEERARRPQPKGLIPW